MLESFGTGGSLPIAVTLLVILACVWIFQAIDLTMEGLENKESIYKESTEH